MPKIPATALAPMAAAQTAAMVRPTAVAARIMASGAPTAVAGVTPTSASPNATEPTMKLGSPRMAGSPPSGPGTATVTASTTSSTWVPDREVLSAVIAAPLTDSLRSHTIMRPLTLLYLSRSPPPPGTGPETWLGQHGLAGFQQGLEAGNDLRPAGSDHVRHGAAGASSLGLRCRDDPSGCCCLLTRHGTGAAGRRPAARPPPRRPARRGLPTGRGAGCAGRSWPGCPVPRSSARPAAGGVARSGR